MNSRRKKVGQGKPAAAAKREEIKGQPIVFVVDDDLSVREGLEGLVRSAGWRVETFHSASEFLRREVPDGPACLVLDVRLPGLSGMDLQRELAAANRHLPIIFITGHGDIPTTVRAMKAGAVEFLTKPFVEGDLLASIEQAIKQDQKTISQLTELTGLRERSKSLTAREREVMSLVVRGMMNKEVAAALGTHQTTVKAQRGRMMRKMRAVSLAELVRMAQRLERDT
jgi:FixJ family two-component response regulator